MKSLKPLYYAFALSLFLMGILFFRVEWNTRCELNPELNCGESVFVPISDSIPRNLVNMRLSDLTQNWDEYKSNRLRSKLLPVLTQAELHLRERLRGLSPLGASAYLHRYFRQTEQELELSLTSELEDYYRLLMLQAIYKASEAIEENGGITSLSESLFDFSGPQPAQRDGESPRYRFAEVDR